MSIFVAGFISGDPVADDDDLLSLLGIKSLSPLSPLFNVFPFPSLSRFSPTAILLDATTPSVTPLSYAIL